MKFQHAADNIFLGETHMAPKLRQHANNHHDHDDKIDLTKATTSKKKTAKRSLDTRIINENTMQQCTPLTQKQQDMFNAFLGSENQLLAIGSAGTGKSFIALYLALKDVLIDKNHKRIILLRSPMSVNSQGFLPGTLEEKEAVYERPYVDIVNWLFDHNDAYSELKDAGIIQFMTTSYIRGLTWNDSIIIADEVQNMVWEEINTIATRIGSNSRILFLGDAKQDDIKVSKRYQESGIEKLLKVAYSMKQFDIIEFMPSDIVRNELVKSWIIACELNKL